MRYENAEVIYGLYRLRCSSSYTIHVQFFFYSGEELFRDKNRVMLRNF
jgi:hypothetical protein